MICNMPAEPPKKRKAKLVSFDLEEMDMMDAVCPKAKKRKTPAIDFSIWD